MVEGRGPRLATTSEPAPTAIDDVHDFGGVATATRADDAPNVKPEAKKRSQPSLYRVIWRWHFYAGLLVTPILLIVTITGALYIFRAEIEDFQHAGLRFVTPAGSTVSPQAIVDAARGTQPRLTPREVELSGYANRSAVVRMGDETPTNDVMVYVDPYRGMVLGSQRLDSPGGLETFFDVVLTLHRQLFLGTTGRILVELTVGWTILLMVTGIYLWWPKNFREVWGVWWFRWMTKPYTVLRDLHTVLGFYLLIPMFIIVFTGLFYSLVWMEGLHIVLNDEASLLRNKPAADRLDEKFRSRTSPTSITLDQAVVIARQYYPDRNLAIALDAKPGEAIRIRAATDYTASYGEYKFAQFALDQIDGRVVSHKTLAEDPEYWYHGWTYPLHVGSVLGMTTKILWLIACLILIGLPVTGVWMWWIRRPNGGTGFPKRPDRPIGWGLVALIIALSLLLPVVGLSIVLILLGELAIGFTRTRLHRPRLA